MPVTLSPAPTKKLSKSACKKRENSKYWRKIQVTRDTLKEERDLFQQQVVVLTLKTTDSAESFSAIIDSRRGIVIK